MHGAALAAAAAVHAPFSLYQNLPLKAPILIGAALAVFFAVAVEPSDRSFFWEFRRRAYSAWLFVLLCLPIMILAYGMKAALIAATVQTAAGGLASVGASVLRRSPWAVVLIAAAAFTIAA